VRFFLDENVDVSVGAVLRDAGHECWTAVEAGLSGAIDDAIAVYADDRKAILVSQASMSHLVVEVTLDRVTCHPPRWR
jgi:predicted nuclease of predicted toxin-antitoxin system